MSSTIKKVVKLSYEQYHDLITTGKTTDKDGNEHIYDNTGKQTIFFKRTNLTTNRTIVSIKETT